MLDVKSRVQQERCNPLLGAALCPACFLPCLCAKTSSTTDPTLPLFCSWGTSQLLQVEERFSFGAMGGRQGGKPEYLDNCGTAEVLLSVLCSLFSAQPAWTSSWRVPRLSCVAAPSLAPSLAGLMLSHNSPFLPRRKTSALEKGPGVNYISLFFLRRASVWDVPGERLWLLQFCLRQVCAQRK